MAFGKLSFYMKVKKADCCSFIKRKINRGWWNCLVAIYVYWTLHIKLQNMQHHFSLLCWKKKFDYQVVASFALQDETTSTIKEAMLILKIWTPLWQPKSFMGENYEKGINSIGHPFPSKGNNAYFRFTRRLLCLQFAKAYPVKFY